MSNAIEIGVDGRILKKLADGRIKELYEIEKQDLLDFVYGRGKLLDFVNYLKQSGKIDESECISGIVYKGRYVEGDCYLYGEVIIKKEDYNLYRFRANGVGRKFNYFHKILKNYLREIEDIKLKDKEVIGPAYIRLEGKVSVLGNVELKEIYEDDWDLCLRLYVDRYEKDSYNTETSIEFKDIPNEDEVILRLGKNEDYRVVADFLLNIDEFIDEAEKLLMERGYRPDGVGGWIKL